MPDPRVPELVALHRRAAALVRRAQPGPGAPYFGYLRVQTGGRVRDVLLGRRAQVLGDLAVVDWQRSPLAEVFLSHREGDEYEIDSEGRTLRGEVLARQLVAFEGDELRAIETETELWVRDDRTWTSAPLRTVQLVPRRGAPPPGEPVTLDPVQRAAVELDRGRAALVLGEAGFGKTTVALYRLAHLQQRAVDEGRPFAGLVIVPTEALRRLSRLMLSRIGGETIVVETFEHWIVQQAFAAFADLPKRLSQRAAPVVSRLKRHPALRTVLQDVVAGTPAMKAVQRGHHERFGSRDPLLHLFGDRELMTRVVQAADGALPASAVGTLAAHTRLQFSSTTEAAYAHVAAERLQTLDGRPIDDGTPRHDVSTIDAEDCAVLFELQHLESGGNPGLSRYDHVVVDEAQELAPIELSVLGRAVARGAALTVAGDEAQQIDETMAFSGWPAVMRELGAGDHERVVLTESYRCPPDVEALARAIVGRAQGPSRAVVDPAPIQWHRCASECHLVAHLGDALARLRERDRRSRIALICRHYESAQRLFAQIVRATPVRLALDGDIDFRPGVIVTCVEEIRGLEFDHVVVPDATTGSYPDDAPARRALYVAITRTMHQLALVAAGPWSPLLRPHVPAAAL